MTDKIWGNYDQAALNVAYNARESVPDFDACIKEYVDESRRVRAAIPGPRSVSYGPHRDQVLDIFPPSNTSEKSAPVHLFLHGGYWRALTKDEHSFTAGALTPTGACVIVNTYSLCPDVHIDVIVRQCRDAIAWIYNNADNHGGDPERIFISGHSAGGQLVGMMLATDWEAEYGLPADVIKGATAISGVFDMRPMRLAFTQEWIELTEAAAAECPDVHIDVIVRQCRDAIAWIYNNADNHGGDPERIFISGHSAGGQLVGMMLATDWEAEYGLPADVIKGATAISGVFDMRPMRLAFTQEWIELTEAAAARNSPLFHLPRNLCPVIVVWGSDDPAGFHEQGRAYIEVLEGHAAPVRHIVLPGCDHFAACYELTDPASPLTQAVIAQMGL